MKTKSISHAITPKALLRLLTTASKTEAHRSVIALHAERNRIRESLAKLREKQKANSMKIKDLTVTKAPEQFQFKF